MMASAVRPQDALARIHRIEVLYVSLREFLSVKKQEGAPFEIWESLVLKQQDRPQNKEHPIACYHATTPHRILGR